MSSMLDHEKAVELVRSALVEAGSILRGDKKHAYGRAIKREKNKKTRWVPRTILENTETTEKDHSPLCDGTGIPHLVLGVGPNVFVAGRMLDTIRDGIAGGLGKLPDRPVRIMGSDSCGIDQSDSLGPDPTGAEPAPILLRTCGDSAVRLRIMIFGSEPIVRAKTYKVSHKHNTQVVIGEVVKWTAEGVAQPECSPCTLAVGIGRSHSKAASMMLQTQADGYYDVQSEMEVEITK